MPEKRDSIRFRKRLRLRFGKGNASTLAFTEDVSMTGLFIKTPNVIQPGSRISIEVDIPDHETVAMEGVIMWAKKVPLSLIHRVNKSGMGIRILKMTNGGSYVEFIEALHDLRESHRK